jgi:hypothetical protein
VQGISDATFNKGSAQAAAQFDESRKAMEMYARNKFNEGDLIAEEIRTGIEPTINLPPYLPPRPTTPAALAAGADADAQAAHAAAVAQHAIDIQEYADKEAIRKAQVKSVATRREDHAKDRGRAFTVIYNQCSQDVKDKLKASTGWENIDADQDLGALMNKIQGICVGIDEDMQPVAGIVQAQTALYLLTQPEGQTPEEYARQKRALFEACEKYGGSPGSADGMTARTLRTAPWATIPPTTR